MKILIVAAATLVTAVSAVPLRADELPQRKPGLWETKSTGAEGQTIAKQCVGPGTDQAVMGALAGGACAKTQITKTATGYNVATECTMGAIKASGSSVITGDFQTQMRTEGSTTLTGMPGQSAPVERKIVVEARRLGDCEAGQKPGDIIMPDGKVIPMPGARPAP
jgi:hypothetical protein